MVPLKSTCCLFGNGQLRLSKRSPFPSSHLPIRSNVCYTLALLLFICLLHNGHSPTWSRSTNLYTQMTTNGQHCVNRWPVKSLRERLRSLFIKFSSHVLGIYLWTVDGVKRCYVSKVQGNSVYWWPNLSGVA